MMDLDKFLKNVFEISVTNRCNFRCNNCIVQCAQFPDSQDLDYNAITEFNECIRSYGKIWLHISGGEPSLYDRISLSKILSIFESNQNIESVLIFSNGSDRSFGQQYAKSCSPSGKISMRIDTTTKNAKVSNYYPGNTAPCDIGVYNKCIWRCNAPEKCGITLAPNGFFYPCVCGAAIDRVFKFNLGIQKFSDITDARLKEQCMKYCKLCGMYLMPHRTYDVSLAGKYKAEKTSKSFFTASWVTIF